MTQLSDPLSTEPEAPHPASVTIEALIGKAIEHGASVESLERLISLRASLHEEAAREAFFAALSAFQAACPIIPKERVCLNKDGRTVRYRYAPLDTIVRLIGPLLERFGLSYRVETRIEPGSPPMLVAVTHVHHRLGYSTSSEFRVPIDNDAYMSGPQKFGSAGSYAKRYSLCNAFGILTGEEDDDAPPPSERIRPAPAPRRPDVVSAAQVRRLEARIGELKLDREKVKAWLAKSTKGKVEHFRDMSPSLYDTLDARLTTWASSAQETKA